MYAYILVFHISLSREGVLIFYFLAIIKLSLHILLTMT